MGREENLYTKIFKKHWIEFKQNKQSYATADYDEVVSKMINCGDPKFGYIEYGCTYCGEQKHRIGFTCKSPLCLSCGRVNSENFVFKVMKKLHPGIIYRHLILTVPDQLLRLFYQRRKTKDLYNEFYKTGWEYIQDVFHRVKKKRLRCGAIIVLHITGRKGNYRPHLHIIVMNGGIDLITGKWVNIGYFPYEKILPKKWQWHLLNMIKRLDASQETKKLVDSLWKKYPKGFYNNFKKGDVPSKSQYLVAYLSKYLFRPQISVKRIKEYNGEKKRVVYEYADHRTGKTEIENVSVIDFIGRMAQQVLPKRFHRVKYYGLQHGKNYQRSKVQIENGMKKIKLSKRDRDQSVFRVAKNNYQDRMKLWTGTDPLKCPSCGHQMELIIIWTKEKGIVFDLLKEYQKRAQSPPGELKTLKEVRPTEPRDIIENFYEQLDLAL